MWSSRLLIALALVVLTICTPIDSNDQSSTKRETTSKHLVTGLATRNNGRLYLRREIRELKANAPDQWNLFLLATQAFRQMDANDQLSSYQILGIHGMPFVTWQDAPGVQGERWLGFCPHNTNVFATWHRPFVALYEQELSKQVHIIASTATTDKPRWLAAADAFRMPYFDAGLGVAAGELPDFFTNPYIQVTGTSGTNVIANPLFQYDLPSRIKQDFVDDKNGGAKWTQYNHTLRYPDTYHTNARSQPDKFRSMWYGQRKMFQDGIGRAFAKTTFTTFATDLENWHGWFHNTGAGYGDYKSGHFLPSEYSAFDPLFMLHHANVDRMLSLFQALNPSTWLQSVDSGIAGFYWSLPYTTISSSTGLQPFWKSDTEFYTSDDVRDTAVFGYAYPETQYWDYASTDDWRKAVTAYVARTYAPAPRQMLAGGEGQMGMEGVGHVLVDGTYEDWNVEVMADVGKLPGTFRVEFSLAGEQGAPVVLGQWMHSSPLGTNADWKTTHTQPGNAKPKRASTLEMTRNGTVGLTAGLLERVAEGRLASLDADAVVPYLAERLGVSVTGANNIPIPPQYLPSAFSFTIVSAPVRIPKDADMMLEYSDDVTRYSEITVNSAPYS